MIFSQRNQFWGGKMATYKTQVIPKSRAMPSASSLGYSALCFTQNHGCPQKKSCCCDSNHRIYDSVMHKSRSQILPLGTPRKGVLLYTYNLLWKLQFHFFGTVLLQNLLRQLMCQHSLLAHTAITSTPPARNRSADETC